MTGNTTQKTFERLQDFNLIYIVDFNRLKIPEIVEGNFIKRHELKVLARNFLLGKKLVDNTQLPPEVLDSFRFGNNTIAHQGIIYKKVLDSDGNTYCDTFNDSSEPIKQAIDFPELKHTINIIAHLNRRSVMTRDLLSLPGFKPIENENLGIVSLELEELTSNEKKVKICKIILKVQKDFNETSIDLGTLTYTIYGRRV